ncbi:hypothetical protein D3C72_2395560 [compost metagenome]
MAVFVERSGYAHRRFRQQQVQPEGASTPALAVLAMAGIDERLAREVDGVADGAAAALAGQGHEWVPSNG